MWVTPVHIGLSTARGEASVGSHPGTLRPGRLFDTEFGPKTGPESDRHDLA